MKQAVVRADEWDVEKRLADFDLNRKTLLEIVDAAVMGRNGCTENDPPGTYGYEAYRWGTRHARELLRAEGWELDNTGGVATVVNHARRFRMCFMNADGGAGTVDQCPQNRCKKGANSERIAAQNGFLFDPDELPVPAGAAPEYKDGYTTWYLCVYIKGDPDQEITVRAELTLLSEFVNGFFRGFSEKIVLIKGGDWAGPRRGRDEGDGGDEDEYEVKVVRR